MATYWISDVDELRKYRTQRLIRFALDKLKVGTTLTMYRGSPNTPDPQIEQLTVTYSNPEQPERLVRRVEYQSDETVILRNVFRGIYKDSFGSSLRAVNGDINVTFSRVFLILHDIDQPNEKQISVELVISPELVATVGLKF